MDKGAWVQGMLQDEINYFIPDDNTVLSQFALWDEITI
jgi:hypothetical protein